MITDAIDLLVIFVLAAFVGFEVISKVPSILHTPLMSGSNAIHGIILVGAMFIASQAQGALQMVLAFVAVFLATLNIVGGVVVTDRMLDMFKGRQQGKAVDGLEDGAKSDAKSMTAAVHISADGLTAHIPAVCRLLHPGAQGAEFTPQRPLRQPRRRRRDGRGHCSHLCRPEARARLGHRRRDGPRGAGRSPDCSQGPDDGHASNGRYLQRRRGRGSGSHIAGGVPARTAARGPDAKGRRNPLRIGRGVPFVLRQHGGVRKTPGADDRVAGHLPGPAGCERRSSPSQWSPSG